MKAKPSAEYVLLGALMSGAKHGYEIMQFIEKVLGATWFVGTSQLYMLLKKLEQKDLLHSSLEHQKTRPSKKIFSLTPDGKKTFLTWLNTPIKNVRDFRIEFLTKIFFFNHLSIEGGRELIDSQIEMLTDVRMNIKQKHKAEKDSYVKLVYSFKLATVEGLLQWLVKKAKPFMLCK